MRLPSSIVGHAESAHKFFVDATDFFARFLFVTAHVMLGIGAVCYATGNEHLLQFKQPADDVVFTDVQLDAMRRDKLLDVYLYLVNQRMSREAHNGSPAELGLGSE